MNMLLIAPAGLCMFFIVRYFSRLTKLEPALLYLLAGAVIRMLLHHFHKGELTDVFPAMEKYNSMALMFMFFTAGFAVNVKQLKKSGKTTAKLIVLPGYAETAIMSVVIYFVLRYIPVQGISLSYAEALIIAGIFAVSSAANIIPLCTGIIQRGHTGKNNIPGTMITVSVVDGFITVPVVFVAVMLLLAENTGREMNLLTVTVMTVLTLACIVLAIVLGLLLGRIHLLLSRGVFRKLSVKGQSTFADYSLIFFAFFMALLLGLLVHEVHSIREAVSVFGILIMWGIGLALKNYDQTGASEIVKRKGPGIFQMLGMPVIFVYVGSVIDTERLLDPELLLILAGITFLAVVVKGAMGRFVLRGDMYTEGERRFVSRCFIPKGVSLINFTVLFSEILGNNQELISFMSMVAAAGILITMTWGIPLIRKAEAGLE